MIDLTTAPGASSDTTSDLEIREAADRVIDQCVRQPGPTSGGSVGAVGRSTLFLGDSRSLSSCVLTFEKAPLEI